MSPTESNESNNDADERRNLGIIAKSISTFLAIIPTLLTTIGRGVFGSMAFVSFGLLNILRNGTGFVVGLVAILPNIARKILGRFSAGMSEAVVTTLKTLVVTVKGAFKETANLFFILLGAITGLTTEAFNLTLIFLTASIFEGTILAVKIGAILTMSFLAALSLGRKVLGAVLGLITEAVVITLKFLSGFAALLAEILNIGIRLLGIVVGLMAQTWNILRFAVAVVFGLASEVLLFTGKTLLLPFVLALETLNIVRKLAAVLNGLANEIINVLKMGIGVIAGLIAEGFNIARKLLALTIGLFFETTTVIRKIAAGIIALLPEAVILSRKFLGLTIGGLAETYNIGRTVLAAILAPIAGSIYGFFGGGLSGLKKVFSAVFKNVGGNTPFGAAYTSIYNRIASHTPFLAAYKYYFDKMAGPHALGYFFSDRNNSRLAGTTPFRDVFIHAYQFFAGNTTRIGLGFMPGFNSMAGNAAIGVGLSLYWSKIRNPQITYLTGTVFASVYQRIAGNHSFREVFNSAYERVAGNKKIGTLVQSVYINLTNNLPQLGLSFKFIYAGVGGEFIGPRLYDFYNKATMNFSFGAAFMRHYRNNLLPIGRAFTATFRAIAGNRTPGAGFAETYSAMSEHLAFGNTFIKVNRFVSGNTSIKAPFHLVNRSAFFGILPWWKQQVASRMFQRISGYDTREGLKTVSDHIISDFNESRKHTDIICTGTNGFLRGAAASIALIIAYPLAGISFGFVNAGFPGAVIGLFSGLYKAITFPFRNSYRNAKHQGSLDNINLQDLVIADWHQLEESTLVIWETLLPEDAAPILTIVPDADNETSSHAGPLTVLHAGSAHQGGRSPTPPPEYEYSDYTTTLLSSMTDPILDTPSSSANFLNQSRA